MAVTISIGNSTGINFNAYLKQFETGFTKTGYGSFSDPTDDVGFSANDYVSYDEATGQSVIFGSGSDDWDYDLATHIISGSLETIQFGFNTQEDTENEIFTNDGDISISGLGIEETTTSDGTVVNDLMNSSTDSLVALLKSVAVNFVGGKGDDVFKSYSHDDTLSGGKGDDTFKGGKGDDRLIGGKGDDSLTGNGGEDTFVFAAKAGHDTIKGFDTADDVIEFASALFADFDGVQAAAKDTDGGVVIEFAGGSVLLAGLEVSDLQADDFSFA